MPTLFNSPLKPNEGAVRKFQAFALVLLILLVSPVSALATGGDRIPGSRYVSGRGAALGDAYIGLADTVADSLFYNPAGLGRVNGITFEPINIQLQSNDKLVSNIGRDFINFQSLDKFESNLLKKPGTNPGGGFSVMPAFGFRGFGAGLLYQSRLMAETDGTNIRYRTVYQFIPTAGFGLRLASGVLRIGYVLQYVNQASGDVNVAVGTRPLGWSEGISQGKGFSHNLGMALTLPYIYQPSINVVARNVGSLKLSGKPMFVSAKNPSGTIATERMSLDSSIGFLTKISAGWNLSTQFAYRDATNTSGSSFVNHFATGLEFTAMDRFFIRAGFGSGFPSAGLGIRTSRSEVNFAWFSEDLGTGSQSVRDLRYMFQFMFRAF
jgi:hypothetical protein